MKEARGVCDRLHAKNLVIPRVRKQGDYLIEERLPIPDFLDAKERIGFYSDNRALFTQAAEEFAALMCHASLSDKVSSYNSRTGYEALSEVPFGRYDNIVPFIDRATGTGQIGLIDLEHFNAGKGEGVYDAICLFPYHYREIIAVARRNNFIIDEEAAAHLAEKALSGFEKLYGCHITFLKANGITLEEPFKVVPQTEEQKGQVIENVQMKIREWKSGNVYDVTPFLKAVSDDILEQFAKEVLPELIEAMKTILVSTIKQGIKEKGPIDSYANLAFIRSTFEFVPPQFTFRGGPVWKIFWKFLEERSLKDVRGAQAFLNQLAETVLENWKDLGAVALFEAPKHNPYYLFF